MSSTKSTPTSALGQRSPSNNLSVDESLAVGEAFLITLYTYDIYERWVELKKRMNFTRERDFVVWLMDCVENQDGSYHPDISDIARNVVKPAEVTDSNKDTTSCVDVRSAVKEETSQSTENAKDSTGDSCDESGVESFTTSQQVESPTLLAQGLAVQDVQASLGSALAPIKLPNCASDQQNGLPISMATEIFTAPIICKRDAEMEGVCIDAGLELDSALGGHCVNSINTMNESIDDGSVYFPPSDSSVSVWGTGVGPHKKDKQGVPCPYCNKRFKGNYNKQRHINDVHLKLKEHACLYCDRSFAQPSSLKSHMRRAHPEACTTQDMELGLKQQLEYGTGDQQTDVMQTVEQPSETMEPESETMELQSKTMELQ